MPKPASLLIGMALTTLLWTSGTFAADPPDETADSAAWLLRKSTLLHRDGRHNVMLRALRQLRDPTLKPLFTELVQKGHPALKYHGVLALAEVSAPRKLDLALLADLKDPLVQAQVVNSAIEAELLDADGCRQILESPGYDTAVRIIAAAKLAADGQLKELSAVSEAQSSDKLAMRGMLGLLKLQIGDGSGLELLRGIDASDDRTRDEVRAMLLQMVLRYKFAAAGPWAMRIAQDDEVNKSLAFLALRAAMSFKVPGAAELWAKRFGAAKGDPADRIRLALLALDVSKQVGAVHFKKLTADSDPLVAQIGRTGESIASSEGSGADEQLMKLLELNHGLTGQWVLQYAYGLPVEQGRGILVAAILAAEGEPNPSVNRGSRIENCVFAAQRLAEKDPASHPVLIKLLETSPELTQEAILMGLLKSELGAPHKLIEGLAFKSQVGQSIALLIRARGGAKLSSEELRHLSLMVRGGAGLQETLRLQAAWVYLKITEQDRLALTNVLGK